MKASLELITPQAQKVTSSYKLTSLYLFICFIFLIFLTSLFSSFSSMPMLMESKDLPLRGPSTLFEYMLKGSTFIWRFFLSSSHSAGVNSFNVFCLCQQRLRAVLFNHMETGGGHNLRHSSKWRRSSASRVIGLIFSLLTPTTKRLKQPHWDIKHLDLGKRTKCRFKI